MTFIGDKQRGYRWMKSVMAEVQSGRSGWLAGVRTWRFVQGIGPTLQIGEKDRILVVGQAPARDGDELPPFHGGRTGRTVCQLLGCADLRQLRERYDTINAWPWYEGAIPAGDRFVVADTRDLLTLVEIRSSVVVLLGAARRAFGVKKTVPWFTGFRDADRPGPTWYCAPHPSGRNHWWNSAVNRKRAEAFFRRVRTGGVA